MREFCIKFLLTWWNIDLFSKKLGKALVDFLDSLLGGELRHFLKSLPRLMWFSVHRVICFTQLSSFLTPFLFCFLPDLAEAPLGSTP